MSRKAGNSRRGSERTDGQRLIYRTSSGPSVGEFLKTKRHETKDLTLFEYFQLGQKFGVNFPLGTIFPRWGGDSRWGCEKRVCYQ